MVLPRSEDILDNLPRENNIGNVLYSIFHTTIVMNSGISLVDRPLWSGPAQRHRSNGQTLRTPWATPKRSSATSMLVEVHLQHANRSMYRAVTVRNPSKSRLQGVVLQDGEPVVGCTINCNDSAESEPYAYSLVTLPTVVYQVPKKDYISCNEARQPRGYPSCDGKPSRTEAHRHWIGSHFYPGTQDDDVESG